VALEDIEPDRAFLVYSRDERYSRSEGLEAIGLEALTEELHTTWDRVGGSDPGQARHHSLNSSAP
jgi:hypothetical protein